ncbi:MAG: HEAT repeat domain-containing protein [Blastocatellia bacterium]
MNRFLTSYLLGMTIALALCAPASGQELYKQCESLSADGELSAEVKKHLAAMAGKDPVAREKAAVALETVCDKRVTEPLISLTADENPKVRIAALRALGKIGDRAAIDPLLELLPKEKDWDVIYYYVEALSAFQVHRSGYAVLNSIANAAPATVKTAAEMRTRCHAVVLVHQLHEVNFSRKALGFIFGFLDHTDPALAKIAEEHMYQLKDTRNGPHELPGILKITNYPTFKIKAATWIGRLGIEDARYALEAKALSESDPQVLRAVKDAIAMLDQKLK